ncbi:MAG: polysaccharide deacetylase [Anaerocolumna sp.]|jgi:peptidoglycan/xylan/chitin deacetylase (PgdA/CDA1 family)|nr:polysaccharide deacetylase [Anaerocolumna sp.]
MFQGKMKAVTFSYDDGVEQDRRLVEIFNKYGMKCTFNLNSGIQTGTNGWINAGVNIKRMNIKGLKELYAGHEIASHSLTHPHLEEFDEETIYNEIMEDKLNLERIFEKEVVGFAYPYGSYNTNVCSVLRECGMGYARTVHSTFGFEIPNDLITLPATCHHNHLDLMKLAKEFVELKADKPQVFYIWGHSYEFDVDNNWHVIEELCEYLSGRDDIFYGTNAEVLLNKYKVNKNITTK